MTQKISFSTKVESSAEESLITENDSWDSAWWLDQMFDMLIIIDNAFENCTGTVFRCMQTCCLVFGGINVNYLAQHTKECDLCILSSNKVNPGAAQVPGEHCWGQWQLGSLWTWTWNLSNPCLEVPNIKKTAVVVFILKYIFNNEALNVVHLFHKPAAVTDQHNTLTQMRLVAADSSKCRCISNGANGPKIKITFDSLNGVFFLFFFLLWWLLSAWQQLQESRVKSMSSETTSKLK